MRRNTEMNPEIPINMRRRTVENVMEQRPRRRKNTLLWATKAIAEEIGREATLAATLVEFLIYSIFLIVFTISTFAQKEVSMFYVSHALRRLFFDTVIDKDENFHEMRFMDIRTANDFWMFAETIMVDGLYWEKYYDPESDGPETKEDDRKLLFENKLLGVPRMRQIKVRNNSCIVHDYFKRFFLNCYDIYSFEAEDTEPFGLENGTAWTYSSAEETENEVHYGIISNYGGGGFYQDLGETRDKSLDIITDLKNNLWITRGTRVVFVDFTVYNGNLNIFCICKFTFEFPPTGGVVSSGYFRTYNLITSLTMYDWFVFACECITILFILYYVLEELREVFYFKWKYLLQFWNYIDLFIILTTFAAQVPIIMIDYRIHDALDIILKNQDKYGNLEKIASWKKLRNELAASCLCVIYIKLFKFISLNQTMGQLNNTLKACAMDVFGFSIMFFIIFFAFAELGYLIFGSQVQEFSTFGISMFTLLRTILGDFEYGVIEKVNRVMAPMYFLSFIFFVFFVLLNMFLAIINDTYIDVKTELAIAPQEMQMTEFIRKKFYNCLRRWGFKLEEGTINKSDINKTIHKISDVLKKCGFSEAEISLFFAKYDIDTKDDNEDFNIEKLMSELSMYMLIQEHNVEETQVVRLRQFMDQQQRLEQIEATIEELVKKVQMLVNKLNTLKIVKKTKLH